MGRQLYGKTLGVVGLGRIGQQVSLRAQAFGMDVVAYDPYVTKERAAELGLKLVPLARLLKQSDFVTLHAPTSEATRGLMSADNLGRMKRGACLVNCARGNLVDEQALAEALKSGHLGGAAIDVYQQEPPTGSPLLGIDNVVLTPHLAASTAEAQAAVSVQVARQVINILGGTGYDNVLNLPFLGRIAEMRPHLTLSARVGSLSAQILGAPASRIEWDYSGGPEEYNDGVRIALLRGILEPLYGREVNFINAGRLADECKLRVFRAEGLADARDHVTVSCRLTAGRKSRLVVGALVGREWLRIIQIDGYRLEAEPTGDLLFTVNRDVPGVIGKVGTLLGKAGLNIGEWRLGRDKAKKKAVTLINLDSPLPARTLAALRRMEPILEAHGVFLGNDE